MSLDLMQNLLLAQLNDINSGQDHEGTSEADQDRGERSFRKLPSPLMRNRHASRNGSESQARGASVEE